jgi:signal transduction histidine kinase
MSSADSPNNELLARLDEDVRGALSLVPVQLDARESLQEPGMPVLMTYFPVTAVVSLISTMESGVSADVALIGREGIVGLAGVHGSVESPTTALVQVPGLVLRTPTAAVRAASLRFPSLRTVLDRYTEARFVQVAQTAACNRLHSVEARLARLLLEIDDRIDGGRFTLSQELISQMLGVQRPTVSIAMHRFAEEHAVSYRRRAIVILDRSKLERFACECHHVLRRMFGQLRRPPPGPADVTVPPAADDPTSDPAAAWETMREIAGRMLVANIREHEAREQAQAANHAKDEFLAQLSHELRTPLNAILGWCARLREPGAQMARGLEVIQENAAAQLRLVEDLLATASIASSPVAIQPATVNLVEVARSAVDAVKPAADDKQIALELQVGPDLEPIYADADRLRQALLNVVTNAVKFTAAGGQVQVCIKACGDTAQIIVRDTGSGITAAVLPHIFEPFRQGESAGRSRGVGLGLTIAQSIVQLHGGSIRLESPGEGQGTTCTIAVPVRSGRGRD